jgi:phosphohistidine phosphatase
MRCYFLRHGPAGDPGDFQGADFDRPLTGEGQDRMAREAKTIAELSLDLDLILTSPLVRAKQTAAIVASGLKLRNAPLEDERLGLGFDAKALASILREHADANAIMLVGHEPSMSQTIGQLVGGARIDLKKGGLACVNLPSAASSEGQLAWLIPPKVLALGKRH